jgi:hypothetical protein
MSKDNAFIKYCNGLITCIIWYSAPVTFSNRLYLNTTVGRCDLLFYRMQLTDTCEVKRALRKWLLLVPALNTATGKIQFSMLSQHPLVYRGIGVEWMYHDNHHTYICFNTQLVKANNLALCYVLCRQTAFRWETNHITYYWGNLICMIFYQ